MKSLILFLLIIQSAFANTPTKDNSDAQVWGKLIYIKEGINGFKYFVQYQKNKVTQAYPIILKTKKQQKDLQSLIGKPIKVKGKTQIYKRKGEFQDKQILYFSANQVSGIKLTDLKALKGDTPNPNNLAMTKDYSPDGGIELPDNVANTIIFAAGAALLGSIIVTKTKK